MSHYDRVQADILATCGLSADLAAATAVRRGRVDYEDYAYKVAAIVESRNVRGNARGRRPRSLPLLDAWIQVKRVPCVATLSEVSEGNRSQYCDEHTCVDGVVRVWAKWMVLMPAPLFDLVVARRNLVPMMSDTELVEAVRYRKLLWQAASKNTNVAKQRGRPYDMRPANRHTTPAAPESLFFGSPSTPAAAAPEPLLGSPSTPAAAPEPIVDLTPVPVLPSSLSRTTSHTMDMLMRQRHQGFPVQTTLAPIGEALIVIKSL